LTEPGRSVTCIEWLPLKLTFIKTLLEWRLQARWCCREINILVFLITVLAEELCDSSLSWDYLE
jgi:hypothetical protein